MPEPVEARDLTAASRDIIGFIDSLYKSGGRIVSSAVVDMLRRRLHDAEREAALRADTARVPEGLREALSAAELGLDVLHSPHFEWGCNAQNCSGQAALDAIAALATSPERSEDAGGLLHCLGCRTNDQDVGCPGVADDRRG